MPVHWARTACVKGHMLVRGPREQQHSLTTPCLVVSVGKKGKGPFSLDVAISTLSYFSTYFNIAYPLPKADLGMYNSTPLLLPSAQGPPRPCITTIRCNVSLRAYPRMCCAFCSRGARLRRRSHGELGPDHLPVRRHYIPHTTQHKILSSERGGRRELYGR